jgi:hypothetical protein
MPTPRSNWRPSLVKNVTTISPAGWMAALHELITEEVAANPTTAHWTVSHYDDVNGTLELKKLRTPDAVRILLFGGRTPSPQARWQTEASSLILHACLCPTAATTGPDRDYAVGSPYVAVSTLGAGLLSTVAANGQTEANRIRYVENAASLLLVAHNSTSGQHTGYALIGDLCDDPFTGAPVWMVMTSGATTSVNVGYSSRLTPGALSGSLDTSAVTTSFAIDASGKFWNMTSSACNPTTSIGLPNTIAIREGAPAQCMGPLYGGGGYSSAAGGNGPMLAFMKDGPQNKSALIPIPLVSVTTQEFIGTLRQVCAGPWAPIGAELKRDGAPFARAISCDPLNSVDAIWLAN